MSLRAARSTENILFLAFYTINICPLQMENKKTLLKVMDLKKYFQVEGHLYRKKGFVHAVDGVTFEIERGQTLGVAGESGCGKTTVGKLILRLIEPDSGEIYFDGLRIQDLDPKEMRKLRCDMSIVFQDSQSSFNPRMTLNDIIGRPLEVFEFVKGPEKSEKVKDLLKKVGMNPASIDRYPHELSGGQQQRVGIARALALKPRFIVLDEPTSALDVSVQAQILNLLKDLQILYGLSYLFISHNLTAVSFLSHAIAIMYLGKIVEIGPTAELFQSPHHPYTQALIAAIPVPDPEYRKTAKAIRGDVPSSIFPPDGCRFHTRCQIRRSMCKEAEPKFHDLGGGHYVACHLEST